MSYALGLIPALGLVDRLNLEPNQFSSGGTWPPKGARFAIDYVTNRYYRDGNVHRSEAMSHTRNSPEWWRDAPGVYSQFAVDVLARTNFGASIEPAASNDGRTNFNEWATGATGTTATQDAVGPDGQPNTAWTVTAAANSQRQRNNTVTADTLRRLGEVFIKKTIGVPTFYPALRIGYAGGGSATAVLNPTTGLISARNTFDCGVTNEGEFWRLWVALANNGVSTTCFNIIYPAYSADGSITRDTSVTGTTVFAWGQLESKAVGGPTTPIMSVGSTGSRAADVEVWKLPAGSAADMRLVLRDDAQQIIEAVPGGDYAVNPSDLLNGNVREVYWPAPRPALWDNFKRPDGAIGNAPSGQAWSQFTPGNPTWSAALISSGKLVAPPSGQSSTLSYNGADVGKNIDYMLAKFNWTAGSGFGNVLLIANQDGLTSAEFLGLPKIHFLYGNASIDLGIFVPGNPVVINLETINYTQPLVVGPTYTIGWRLVGDTMHLQMPDGQVLRRTDTRFREVTGRYAFYQMTQATGGSVVELSYVEAG